MSQENYEPDEVELNDGLDMGIAPAGKQDMMPVPTASQRALMLAGAIFVLIIFLYFAGIRIPG
jgi:hypothetical protein